MHLLLSALQRARHPSGFGSRASSEIRVRATSIESVYYLQVRSAAQVPGFTIPPGFKNVQAVRLDVTDLTERTDNAIKFIGDMFYARAYRMAATRVGVPDYGNLVERKLRIAADLYQSMVNEYYQARSFLLEAMVVAILVIELIHLFRGTF